MKWTRRTLTAAIPVAAVACIAGIVSYGHIESLALSEHQTLAASRLLPFAVDLLIVAGSVLLLFGSRLGWLCVVSGVMATLYANVESGIGYGPRAATVAAWPAVAFTVATFALERWLRHQADIPDVPARDQDDVQEPDLVEEPSINPEPNPARRPRPARRLQSVTVLPASGNGHNEDVRRVLEAHPDGASIRQIKTVLSCGQTRALAVQALLSDLTTAART